MKPNRLLLVIALSINLVFSLTLLQARAAFPGNNGKIAFLSDRDPDRDPDFEIFVMNPDGSGQTQLTFNTVMDLHPDWSPDGIKIAFVRGRGDDAEIWVMNADGSGQTQLTFNTDIGDFTPAWSPDGTKIAFVRGERDFNPDIWVMNAGGGGETQLTSKTDMGDLHPAWSPDGFKIAFTRLNDFDNIWVMDADGSDPTQLTSDTALGYYNPDWSPDGTKIVFAKGGPDGGHSEIFVMNADGSDPTQLTFNTDEDWFPDWQTIARAVGGEILTANILKLIAPFLLIITLAVAGAAGILLKKRIP